MKSKLFQLHLSSNSLCASPFLAWFIMVSELWKDSLSLLLRLSAMASLENSNISSSSQPPPSSSSILNSSSHFVTLKLTLDNYLLWKAQIVSFLRGHQLYEYIDGSLPVPPSMLNNLPNPTYTKWLLQDQLIISAINTSLFDSVLAQVLSCSASHEVWSTL